MTVHKFSVDAELLRELGERLVGRPHIALAELIKNSYDADATRVVVDFKDAAITVTDDGHGMSEEDFVKRWMRVGTTKKQAERVSPLLGRPLTGSKGVGRLAAQLLARDIVITSTAKSDPTVEDGPTEPAITASIDWRTAVRAGDLTDVSIDVVRPETTGTYLGREHGTRITMGSLTEEWDAESFRSLAEEIWALQSPFDTDPDAFRIELISPFDDVTSEFDRQMRAIFDIWTARVTGHLLSVGEGDFETAKLLPLKMPADIEEHGEEEARPDSGDGDTEPARPHGVQTFPDRILEAEIELRDGRTRTVQWRIANCSIDRADISFLVFELRYRQPQGIRVGTAREYLGRFGGIAVYDDTFRLPYYGTDNDWLLIERDFGARRTGSELVPKALAVPRGLLQLPRNAQLFGRVAVSTNHERRYQDGSDADGAPGLSIQVTRDRLVDNDAYEQLRVMTRATVDAYAMEKARAELDAVARIEADREPPEPATRRFADLREVLSNSKPDIPRPVFRALETAVDVAVERVKESEQASRTYASILGALATAGMTSMAYEHEMSKQVRAIERLAERLGHTASSAPQPLAEELRGAVQEMQDWAKRATRIRQIFKPLVTRESREDRRRYNARKTVRAVGKLAESLSDGIPLDVSGIPADLLLPEATYPAWTSIIQNVLVNAYNALLGDDDPKVVVVGGGSDDLGWLEFRDNGSGVDLSRADQLWEPFERQLFLPREREEAGLGGMGLGLTIIRMIADEVGLRVRFVPPPDGFATALRMNWRVST